METSAITGQTINKLNFFFFIIYELPSTQLFLHCLKKIRIGSGNLWNKVTL